MKRLLLSTALAALTLSGCEKASPGAGQPNGNPPPDKVEAAQPKTPIDFSPETGRLISPEEVPLLEQINRENVKVVASAMPGIVKITASRPANPHRQLFGSNSPFSFHFGPGGPKSSPPNDPSYGAGVVISKDGYIVTNYHVIEDAPDVTVQLHDQRSFPAKVVAYDAPVDMAVLRIEATDLMALPWGNSDKVQVGEQVFALGNPFDLEDSVSKGIVSATGRNLPDSPTEAIHYVNYIQTDAAINPGNSGGALINIHGEVIGFNDAIASTSGGNMGVGFAIPSNLARHAVEALLKDGKLVRGYLGVRLPESIDDEVMGQLNLGSSRGALLAGVLPKSPADQAHLLAGDFITQVDGQKIGSVADLRLVVSQLPVGKEVEIDYIRNGKPQTTTVKIAELGDEMVARNGSPANENPAANNSTATTANVLNGIQVGDLNDKSRGKYSVDVMVTAGVVVSGVEVGSTGESKGIAQGDVIESASVNRGATQTLAAAKDFADLAKSLKPDQSVVLLVHHGKASSFIYLAPEK